jgi:hypothetical protein
MKVSQIWNYPTDFIIMNKFHEANNLNQNFFPRQLIQGFKKSPLKGSFKNTVLHLGEQILSNAWVENQLLWPRYQTYLKQYQAHKLPLTDIDQAIVDQLSNTGRCVTTLAELEIPEYEAFFQAGEQLFQTLEKTFHGNQAKFQIVPDFSMFKEHLQIFQWGLTNRLLAIAENYIKLPVAYDTCLCNISVDNGVETATRRWHLDNEDRRVLKVIIYFNDVEAEGGPFEFLDPASSKQVLKAAGNRCSFFHSQAFNALVQSQVPTATPSTITGPRGTVIFVDTAQVYHRGQPPVMQSRRAVTFGYCSRRPQRPFRCGRNQLNRHQLEQLAAGLSDKQKDCIFWQDELPMWVRHIPTYSYG